MNCRECKNLLIEYAEGSLDGHPKEGLEQHLEQCPECRKVIENIRFLEDRVLKNCLSFRSIDLEESIMDRIAGERSIRLKAASSAGFFQQIRSLFMKNTALKIAAAAVVVLAVLIGLNLFQSGVIFAQVAEPILHARTMENGFTNMLRVWSEKLSDGFFPENLRNQFMRNFPAITKLTPSKRDKLITDEVLRIIGPEHVEKHFLRSLNPEEWEEFALNVNLVFGFINRLEQEGAQWRYSGSGVRLGEGAREIFRYQMPDLSWRVIYGDLRSEELLVKNAGRQFR